MQEDGIVHNRDMFIKKVMQKNNKQHGFTLIEMMVAISIFAIVVTIGTSGLLSMNAAYKKTRSQRAAFDSMNFVMESMIRELRTGREFTSRQSGQYLGDGSDDTVQGPSSEIYFTNQAGCRVSYSLGNDGILTRSVFNGDDDADCISVDQAFNTVNDVEITSLRFRLRGTGTQSDRFQPHIHVQLTADAKFGSVVTPLTVQTGVTQRLIDVPRN